MLKFCLMASHACSPGPGCVFLQDQNRVVKDYQCYLPSQRAKQGISRLKSAMMKLHLPEEPWVQEREFHEFNKIPKIDLSIRRPVLINIQESCCDLAHLSLGMAEWCIRHEKMVQYLMSRSSEIEDGGLDLFLLSDLMGSQGLRYAMDLQPYAPVVYPSGGFRGPKSAMNFVGDIAACSKIKNYQNNPVLLTGGATQIGNINPILAEYYLSNKPTTTKRQKNSILVPQFGRLATSEEQADNLVGSLNVKKPASKTLKRNAKTKLKSSPRKNNRRATREKDLSRRSYLHACECLLSLIVDKPSEKAAVLSIKNSGPDLPELLTKVSVGIAGTGLAVLLSVVCKASSGSMKPFSASKFSGLIFGLGLVWLSLAVNRLRDTIINISRNATKLRLKDGEIMRRVETILKVIYVRGLTTITMALLAACI